MPVLPASGYGTLQYPTQQPSLGPATPPQDIPVTANMFGASIGAGLQEAGAGLEKAAEHIDNIQTLHNQVVVDDYTTKVEDEINKIMYGDPNVPGDTGYKGLRGEAAVREFPNVRNRINSVIQQYRGSMQNTPQLLKFDESTRRFGNIALSETGRHYDSEYKTYEANAAEGRMTVNHGNIATAAASDNWDGFIQFVKKDQDDIERFGAQSGMPREKIDAMKQERYKGAAKEWAQSLMSRDPVAADKFIENNKDALGDLYPDMKKENRVRARAKQQQDDFFSKPSDPDNHRVIGGAPEDGIPYTPATDLKQGTGLDDSQWTVYRNTLGGWEGSYGSGSKPGHSYIGRYQFGQNELIATADRLGVPVPTEQRFLSDKNMQEQFLENYTLDHHNSLMRYSEYANATPAQRAGILAGAHLVGVDATIDFLRTGNDHKDGNGTRVSSYIHRMERAAATGESVAPTAAGEPNPAPTVVKAPTPTPDYVNPPPGTGVGQRIDTYGRIVPVDSPPLPPPGTAAPAAPAAPKAASVEVWGDSLGVGLKGQLRVGGTAVGGASPSKILANVKAQPEEYWQGKTIILPSGSNREPNAADTMPKVEETIKYLQDHGAKVIAVGYGTKQPERNAQLREIAGRLGVPVIDAEQDDGVHPSRAGYRSMAQKISAQLPTLTPPTPAEPPATTGQETTGTTVPPPPQPSPAAGGEQPPTVTTVAAPGTTPGVTPIPAPPTVAATPKPSAPGTDKYIPPPRDEGMLQDNEVPGLEQKLREFDKRAKEENWTLERYIDAYDYARKRMNQAYVDAQHKRTADRQAQQDNDNKVHDEYIGRMTGDSPNYPTTDEVKSDKRIQLPQTREAILADIMRDAKPNPTTRESSQNEIAISKRMYLPDGDPNKISSEQQIMKEWQDQHINHEARDQLIRDMRDLQATKEPMINRKANNLVTAMERRIRPMKAFGNEQMDAMADPESAERARQYKDYVATEIQRYRQEGKNPNDLFDSKNPNFLGRDEVMKDFLPSKGSPADALLDQVKKGTAQPPPTAPSTTPSQGAGAKPQPVDYNSLAGLQAAVASGALTRDRAMQIAIAKGFVQQPRQAVGPMANPPPAQPSAVAPGP